MKLAFIADTHIANHKAHGGPVDSGINQRCALALKALERAYHAAADAGAQAMFILGDVFDTTRPEPQVVAEVQRIIKVTALRTVVLEGNHDMVSAAAGDHSLGPLAPVAQVASWPQRTDGVVCIPFQPGPAEKWLPEVLASVHAGRPITEPVLALHLGISSHDTPAFMRATHDQVPAALLGALATKYGFKAIFAGNWHFHRVFELATPNFTKAVQVGTLCPTGWDNPGFEGHGTLCLYDTDTGKLTVETIPGPRFLNVPQDKAEVGELGVNASGHFTVFVRVKAAQDKIGLVTAQLQHLKDNNRIEAYEVDLDDAEVRAAARTAATVAQSAQTLDDALTGYVEQMPLPEGVDRAAVLAKAKGFLGGA